MENERIKRLRKELKYLTEEEIDKEIANYKDIKAKDIKNVAKKIYLSRGIDYQKLNMNIISELINEITSIYNIFKKQDKKGKINIILNIVYTIILLILMKVPFILVRDIGYDYLRILSTNKILFVLWNLIFLVLYTVTAFCAFIVLIRSFTSKNKD